MLQHRLFSYGQYIWKIHSSSSLFFIPNRSVSHESPTVPHHVHPTPKLALTDKLPSSCFILIAGGGIIGQSIAYHLGEMGVKDVVLIEKAK